MIILEDPYVSPELATFAADRQRTAKKMANADIQSF